MITGSTGMGNGQLLVSVDHDPTAVATDVPKGSLIVEESTGHTFCKNDDGSTTNVESLISMAFVKTGSQDLTAGTPVNLNITDAKKIRRILRARFWISANGADVGANVECRIALKFFNTDAFLMSELDTNGLGGLLEDFAEFQFVSQDIKVAPNNGAGAVDIDDTVKFGIDDLVRIHDGTNYEFQRLDAIPDADTTSLYDTILKAGSPAWALDNDVSRVLEIRDLGYIDQDGTDEIHLRMIPRAGDNNCRLHYWIEYEGAG
ncbi:hypothetical protein LCGC14_0401530 [marine sediment metagenome]|uniref:Uncharacterized protein n=1 Tax=marine sediment metagenome TaxID=412755 RepID=A0A0F9SWS0_9ZZZZ